MSKPGSNSKVEDVLASIRRLVSNPETRIRVDTSDDDSERPEGKKSEDTLILTSEQRIEDALDESEASVSEDVKDSPRIDFVSSAKQAISEGEDEGPVEEEEVAVAENTEPEDAVSVEEVSEIEVPKIEDQASEEAAGDGFDPTIPSDEELNEAEDTVGYDDDWPLQEFRSTRRGFASEVSEDLSLDDEVPDETLAAEEPAETQADYYEDDTSEADASEPTPEDEAEPIEAEPTEAENAGTEQAVDDEQLAEFTDELNSEAAVEEQAEDVETVAAETEAELETDENSEDATAQSNVVELNTNPPNPANSDISAAYALTGEMRDLEEASASSSADDSEDAVDINVGAIEVPESPETENSDALDLDSLDEEALRELISEIVHKELSGVLGERITRNIRKLVRREVHRTMSTKEFD